MRRLPLGLMFVLLAGLAGCNQVQMEAVQETPPPEKGPTLRKAASVRPLYQFGGGKRAAAGTAFTIGDKAGKVYMVTAAHVMDNDAEWHSVQSASLKIFNGPVVANVVGRPVHLGKPFDTSDGTNDFVFWPIETIVKLIPSKLAAADLKKNEWVWVVGQERTSVSEQKLFRCKVVGADGETILLSPHDKFDPHGFSGGPIFNADGDIVGTVLGVDRRTNNVIASKLSSLKQRLAEAKIELP